ncbi:MAG TPA: methylated-DNA--[protein]-cysteine S-methyltransferase [Gemmatimonadales bacterium]|nr:methylated-DNA--[protein]-cysteine S-methyltransferase [Gemmatimonadales bacterium]
MTLDFTITKTPVGPMALWGAGDELVALQLDASRGADPAMERYLKKRLGAFSTRQVPDAAGAATRLRRYFDGDLGALDEQPLRVLGTEFQRAVWEMLRTIRAGRTVSYKQLATMMARPRAVRAVAAANGANPIALFIPCHRVIAADGTLWGYGGGLPMKQLLLRHEGARFVSLPEQEALSL